MKLQENLLLVSLLASLGSYVEATDQVESTSVEAQNDRLWKDKILQEMPSMTSHQRPPIRGTRGVVKYRRQRRRQREQPDEAVSNPYEIRKAGSLRKRQKDDSRSNVRSLSMFCYSVDFGYSYFV